MALDPSNSRNLEQMALKGLIDGVGQESMKRSIRRDAASDRWTYRSLPLIYCTASTVILIDSVSAGNGSDRSTVFDFA